MAGRSTRPTANAPWPRLAQKVEEAKMESLFRLAKALEKLLAQSVRKGARRAPAKVWPVGFSLARKAPAECQQNARKVPAKILPPLK